MSITKNPMIEDLTKTEMSKLDEMLKSDKQDFNRILEQAYKVMTFLFRQAAREDRLFTLEKEPEIKMIAHEVKDSYNTWDVLTLTVICSGITIVGGLITAMSPLGKTQDIFKKISKVGEGVSGVGQGGNGLVKFLENRAESKRIIIQLNLDTAKRQRDDRDQAGRKNSDSQSQMMQGMRQTNDAAHQMFSRVAAAA